MKLPEHLALSYVFAQLGVQEQFGAVGTGLVVAAGILPDLDGLSVLGGWHCHRVYHRVVGHGLPLTIGGPALLAGVGAGLLGGGSFWHLWAWLQLALLAHLITDILFYDWPVQLAWPMSRRGIGLGLVGWNDLIPTLLLYGGALMGMAWPAKAGTAAIGALTALAVYLGWCAVLARSRPKALAWLTGGWVRRSPRMCRWLTGDFIT
jgi:hypothetical protein